MAELEVIYDPQKELACLINVDEQMGWGPAMVGPRAGELLTVFVDTCPFDLSLLNSYAARDAFRSFLERAGMAPQDQTTQDSVMEAQPPAGEGVGAEEARANAEAAAASDVPEPQPADTDMEADEGTQAQVIDCVNCAGSGVITMGEPPQSSQCGMCKGTGHITVAASA